MGGQRQWRERGWREWRRRLETERREIEVRDEGERGYRG